MQRDDLIKVLNILLEPEKVKDFSPNGLQVEGKAEIQKIVTGVTASQALIDAAIAHKADALIVHHGFFWKGESPVVTGMKKNRLAALMAHDINLFGYHLPLDIHPTLGNNAQLANLLDIEYEAGLELNARYSVPVKGKFKTPLTGQQLSDKLHTVLGRQPLSSIVRNEKISTIAWCTGGGQGYIDLAAEQNIDAYLTGEASEQTIHSSREQNIDFFAAGHHATERYGVKALGEYLSKSYELDVTFIDIDNPV